MAHAAWTSTDLELIFEEISCIGNLTVKPLKGGEGKKEKTGIRESRANGETFLHASCLRLTKTYRGTKFLGIGITTATTGLFVPIQPVKGFTCALGVSPGEFGLKGCLTDGILCVRLTVWCGHWEQRGSSNLKSRGYWLLGGIIRNCLKNGRSREREFFKDVKFSDSDACFVGLNGNGEEILFWLLVIKLWIL